jgi:hypothetical protein
MVELGGSLPEGLVVPARQSLWIDVLWWFASTLLLALIAFALTYVIYRLQPNASTWPAAETVFGRGDLALAALALLGGIFAEVRESSRAPLRVRLAVIITSVLVLMVGVGVYATAQVSTLLSQPIDRLFTSQITLFVLLWMIGTQIFLFLLRNEEARRL